jgi:hypothetical protein
LIENQGSRGQARQKNGGLRVKENIFVYSANGEKGSAMLPEEQLKAYNDFYDSAHLNDILEPKTTLMIHLAVSMAIGCYP